MWDKPRLSCQESLQVTVVEGRLPATADSVVQTPSCGLGSADSAVPRDLFTSEGCSFVPLR
jgi:hypothetical protein